MYLARSSGFHQMFSSGVVRPSTSGTPNPRVLARPSLASMNLPSDRRVIPSASGLEWNAFWNFSSLTRSAFSARLRSVMSVAMPQTP